MKLRTSFSNRLLSTSALLRRACLTLAVVAGLTAPLVAAQPSAAAVPTDFTKSPALTGLSQPVAMEFLPDGRALVAQRFGRIFITDITAANPNNSATFLNVTDLLQEGERGVLGLAVDPDFVNNGYIYVYYTKASTNRARVSRFTSANDSASPASELLIWEDNVDAINDFHWGGGLDFGPDGRLYLTVGDKWDTPTDSQDMSLSAGKILRMNPDASPPTDNPFFGQAGVIDEIWALGLRNPFRSGWDIPTGRYFIGEVGGNRDADPNVSYEDVHLGVAGANYGWPNCEGPDLPDRDACSPPESRPANYEAPIFSYSHDGSNKAIIGGEVYNQQQFPGIYQGAYFYGDFSVGTISYLTFDSNGAVSAATLFDDDAAKVVDISVGPDGSLYYLSLSPGAIYKISYDGAPTIDSISATPTSGVEPLTVNFSSAASGPSTNPLTYSWDFGDGTQGSGANPTHVYTTPGTFLAVLTISDGLSSVSSSPITIAVGRPPTATITSPLDGDLFVAGETVTFSGTATDPDETLDGSNFEWTIDFFHNDHEHPFVAPQSGSDGSFTINTSGHDFHDDTGFEIILRVTDSQGLTDVDTLRIYPDKVDLLVNAQPAGGVVTIDGLPLTTPIQYDTLKGFSHMVEAQASFCDGTSMWNFQSWSDGGARSHEITLGTVDLGLTANYVSTSDCGLPSDAVLILESDAGLNSNNSGIVTSWVDQTASGNDLTSVTGNPTLGTTPSGEAAIDFDGVGDRIRRVGDLQNLPTGSAERSVFVVASHREANWGGFGWGIRGNNRTFGVGVSNTGNFAIEGYTNANNHVSDVAAVDQGWSVQSAVYANNQLSHFVNGSLVDTKTHAFNTFSNYIVLGSQIDGSPQLDMSAAAVYVYDRALSVGERQQVESFLSDKYLGSPADVTPPTINPGQSFVVMNNAVAGDAVGFVAATDNTGVTGYSIALGNTGNTFSIDGAGNIVVADPALLASASQFVLTVEASDAAGNVGSETVIIEVVSPPDSQPPQIDAGQIFSVDDDAVGGDVVGIVAATDNLGITAFTITAGNTGEAFAINVGGELSVADPQALNAPQFLLTIEASDNAGNAAQEDIVVNVNDVTAPVIEAGQRFDVGSNAASGSTVGTVLASDPGGIVDLSIVAGDPSGTFAIDQGGLLTVADNLELQTVSQFVLTIEATDGVGNVDSETVIVDVVDGNPPTIDPGQVFSVDNSAAVADVVGTVTAADDGGVVGFAIVSGDPGGTFAIDPAGEITVADAAGLIGTIQFTLSVEATDGAGNTGSGTVAIDVTDVIPPTIDQGQVLNVDAAAQTGDLIGTVSASDDRAVTGFSITVGDPNLTFAISPSGAITVADPAELASTLQYVLTVEVTDAAGNTASASVVIDVADTVSPTIDPGQQFSITNTTPSGTSVGTVIASDDRGVTGFSFASGNTGDTFTIDASGLIVVADSGPLATATSYALTVEVVDAAGNSATEIIVVEVADVLAPTIAPGQVFSVADTAGIGDAVGTVVSGDNIGVVGFQITAGQANNTFSIDSAGAVTVADPADLASVQQFSLSVEASDAAGNSATEVVLVNVSMADTTSPEIDAGQTFVVNDDASVGDLVGIVTATDNVGVSNFTITAGDPGSAFAIGQTGNITVATPSELLAVTQFTLTVQAADAAGNVASESVSVSVADVTPPTIDPGQTFDISSSATVGQVVGTVTTTPGSGATGFAITAGNIGATFAIDATGVVTVADTAELATTTQFTLTVEAVDAAGNIGTETVTITVADVTGPTVDPGQVFSVDSDATAGDLVGTVTTSGDGGVTSFAITSGDVNNVFVIDATGALTVANAAQLGSTPQFVLTIEASDAVGNIGTNPITIDVQDVTPPTVDSAQTFSIDQGTNVGDAVGIVTASDNIAVTGFAITAGNTGSTFSIDQTGAVTVADTAELATTTQFTLTVEAADAAGNTGAETVTVDVTDSTAPVITPGQSFSVDNTSSANDIVGTVLASDDDVITGFAIVSGNTGGTFGIDSAGALTVANATELATALQFTLTVQATDGAGNTGSATVTVDVLDAVAPEIVQGQVFTISGDSDLGDQVGIAEATDDRGVTGFAITGGDPNSSFAIDSAGVITVAGTSELATTTQFTLTIEAVDAAGNATSEDVLVDVATQQDTLPSGAVLLLESDNGLSSNGSGVITGWVDQSGLGNDLSAVTGNPTLGVSPSGLPALNFDGVGDRIRRVGGLSGLPTGNADRTVLVVAEHREANWGGFGWGVRGNNRAFGVGVSNVGNFAIEGYTTANNHDSGVVAVNQGWTLQSVVYESGQFSHFVDGSLIDSDTHSFSTASNYIVLGSQIDGTPQLDMSASAVVVFDRALTSAELAQAETYLSNKYLQP